MSDVLVLLPPSEGKAVPERGDPVDLTTLGSASLTAHRTTVLAALAKVSGHPDALRVLGVGPSLAAEVGRNTRLRTDPAAAAAAIYSGVLFTAAGLSRLPDDAARLRANRSIRIISALWGVVRPDDRIPAYRLSMATDLPGVGPLARSWRPLLGVEFAPRADDELIVDCRSATYLAAWRPPTGTPGWVTVRVLRELDGRRSVVSHNAKHTRGVLARHLLVRAGAEPSDPVELLEAARELVVRRRRATRARTPAPVSSRLLDAELSSPGTSPRVLTLTVT